MKKLGMILLSTLLMLSVLPASIFANEEIYDEAIALTLEPFAVNETTASLEFDGWEEDKMDLDYTVEKFDAENFTYAEETIFYGEGNYVVKVTLTLNQGTFAANALSEDFYNNTVTLNGKTTLWTTLSDDKDELEATFLVHAYDTTKTAISEVNFDNVPTEYIADGVFSSEEYGTTAYSFTEEPALADESHCQIVTTYIDEEESKDALEIVLRADEGYYFKGDDANGVIDYDINNLNSVLWFDTDNVKGVTNEVLKAFVVSEEYINNYSWKYEKDLEENDLILSFSITRKEQEKYGEDIDLTLSNDLFYIGMSAKELNCVLEGYDTTKMDVEYVLLDGGSFPVNRLTETGSAYLGIFISMKDSKKDHFDKDESDYSYTETVTVNGTVCEAEVGIYSTNEGLGRVEGKYYGKTLMIYYPIEVKAYDHSLYFADGTLYKDSEHSEEFEKSTSWKASGNTLYLNDFHYETSAEYALVLEEDSILCLEGEDISVISVQGKEDSVAIMAKGDLEIKDGYLNINANTISEKEAIGIKADKLKLAGANLSVESYGKGIELKGDLESGSSALLISSAGDGLSCEDITMSGVGTLQIYSDGAGIRKAGNIDVSLGTLISIEAQEEGIVSAKNVTIEKSAKGSNGGSIYIESKGSYAAGFEEKPQVAALETVNTGEVNEKYEKYVAKFEVKNGLWVPCFDHDALQNIILTPEDSAATIEEEIEGELRFTETCSKGLRWHIYGHSFPGLDNITDEDDDDTNGHSGLTVKDNGQTLTFAKDYTEENGSIVINFTNDYLNKMAIGEHTISADIVSGDTTYHLTLDVEVDARAYSFVKTGVGE